MTHLRPVQDLRTSYRPCKQVLWECGGTLAAPAITGATIHKAMAFIAPKVVGGVRAPTPVGELGNVEMTQVRSVGPARRPMGHSRVHVHHSWCM